MHSKPKAYRFPLLFILLYALLQWAYFSAPEYIIRDIFVIAMTVEPASWFIDWLWPELAVAADGTRIVSAKGNVNVLRGCEGTETMLLLLAALFATLRPWKHLMSGVISGLILVYIANQLRIALLFWTTIHHGDLFEVMHGIITPILVVGVTLIFFIVWSKHSERRIPS